MIIKTVHYSALLNLGNYNNERIGFTAELEDGENPEAAIDKLRSKVKEVGGVNAEELYQNIYQKQQELRNLERKARKATEEWNALAEFLRPQGIKKDVVDMPMLTNLLPEVKEEVITNGEFLEDEQTF